MRFQKLPFSVTENAGYVRAENESGEKKSPSSRLSGYVFTGPVTLPLRNAQKSKGTVYANASGWCSECFYEN